MIKLNNLQKLRGFAAISIVIFHSIGGAISYGYDVHFMSKFYNFFSLGVEIFFGISGFVIFYKLDEFIFKPASFLLKRFFRVVPFYILMTTFFVFLAILFGLSDDDLATMTLRYIHSITFTAEILSGSSPLIYVGWSVEWEIGFYTLVFIVLCVVYKAPTKQKKYFVELLIFCVLTLGFLATNNFYFLYFFVGALSARIYGMLGFPSYLVKFNLILIIGLAGLVMGYNWFFTEYVALNVVVLAAVFFLLLGGAITENRNVSPLPIILGDASYSIYLVQVFSIPLVLKALGVFGAGVSGGLAIAISIGLSVISGVALYFLIERPLLLRFRDFIASIGSN